jgi:hypothetical protein
MRCIDWGLSPAEAVEHYRPLKQLPHVIDPGQIRLTLWWGSTAHDVVFKWDGEREAEWHVDISDDNPGLSPMSSAPVWGTAAWTNCKDLYVTYSSLAFGIEGEDVLEGEAPTAGAAEPDQAIHEPQRWVNFAENILCFVRGLLS